MPTCLHFEFQKAKKLTIVWNSIQDLCDTIPTIVHFDFQLLCNYLTSTILTHFQIHNTYRTYGCMLYTIPKNIKSCLPIPSKH